MPYVEGKPGRAYHKDVQKAKTEDLFSYNRGAAKLKAREILEQENEGLSAGEKRVRLLGIINEFIRWLPPDEKRAAAFEGLSLNKKIEILKSFIEQELASSKDQTDILTLESWSRELNTLCP